MKKVIIGFAGLFASGKEVSKKYLEQNYGAKNARFSSILRDILKRLDLSINRDNLIKLSTSLRETFGQDTLARAIANDAKNFDTDIVVIDGVRRMEDIKYLKDLPGFVLVSIDAPVEVRYKWLIARNENVGDDKKTFEDFQADHKRETELEIPEVMRNAKYSIQNDGSLDDLYKKLDDLVLKLTK